MKETFIIRTEWFDAIEDLSELEQSIILKNLFYFHSDKENLINLNNLSVKLVWKLIEPNLIRNINDYDKRRETSKDNGKLGGRPPKSNENKPNKPNKPNETLSVSDSVSDSVSVPVIEPVKEISFTDIEKKAIYSPESFPTWGVEASKFLKDEIFKKNFCKAKNLTYIQVEKFMIDFVVEQNLKAQYKDVAGLKSHFTNHYKKHYENKEIVNGTLPKGFVDVPKDFDYNSENVGKW